MTRAGRLSLPIALAMALVLGPGPALAHRIIASVYPSGGAVEGEIGMSDGTMATDQTVEVFGPDGQKLGETTTDGDGFFLFTPEQPVAHEFRVDLGMGHVASAVMSADDIAAILGRQAGGASPGTALPAAAATIAYSPVATPATPPEGLSSEAREAIAEIVRTETRSLRQEIAAYKEKNDLQTILGGIGYILGLFGIGFYVAARQRLGKSA